MKRASQKLSKDFSCIYDIFFNQKFSTGEVKPISLPQHIGKVGRGLLFQCQLIKRTSLKSEKNEIKLDH